VSLHRTAWGDPTNDLTDDMRLAIARLEGLESWFGSVLPVVYERILEDSLPSSAGAPVDLTLRRLPGTRRNPSLGRIPSGQVHSEGGC
jgi:hypothetical protein